MTDQILVRFAGDGSGVGELNWGQREMWGGTVPPRARLRFDATGGMAVIQDLNDRAPVTGGYGPAPAVDDARAAPARTTVTRRPPRDKPAERPFPHVNDVPGTIGMTMSVDTRDVAPGDMEALVRRMEESAVEAMADPATSIRTEVVRVDG